MPNQPTILVKKKDGTSQRMTMEEFRVYRDDTLAPKHSSTEAPKPVVKPIVSASSQKSPPKADQPMAGVKSPPPRPASPKLQRGEQAGIKSESPMKQWTKEDHKSPLEVGDVKEARRQEVVKSALPENRGDAYDQVMRNLKFPVADELRPRLKSLIVSRVKDIRTDDQVIEYATRAVVNGGLGLTEAQAGELVVAIGTSALQHRSTSAPKHFSTEASDQVNQTPNANSSPQTPTFHIPHSTFPEHRPIMHDVIAPVVPAEETKASVGPIEELQQITLTDFRRLSANPVQAGEILLEKFEGLKNESYLLFIKAVQAWYNSSLYKQYQQITADAINNGVKVGQTLGQMKSEEWTALVKLNEML